VSDPAAVRGVVAEIVARFGRLDILVNNAGISRPAPLTHEAWDAAWAQTLAVNLTGEALMIRTCLPHLQASGAGRVVNIASTEGLGATAGLSPYTASKHGVVGLTRSLAVELGRTGVTFNCVCPGPIRTGMTAAIPEDAKAIFARRRVPLRRYGDPEEVAHMTLSLCLPAASYCNGAVVVVDGGMLAQNT
jgi:3-oxoacyl-[acyl-carrier protein] reductase